MPFVISSIIVVILLLGTLFFDAQTRCDFALSELYQVKDSLETQTNQSLDELHGVEYALLSLQQAVRPLDNLSKFLLFMAPAVRIIDGDGVCSGVLVKTLPEPEGLANYILSVAHGIRSQEVIIQIINVNTGNIDTRLASVIEKDTDLDLSLLKFYTVDDCR